MILLFSDWVLSKPQGGLLGYQYDNLTRELVVQGDLPEGWAWDILVSASGKSDTWPLALGDGQASITLTDDNLSVRGEYYLQLRGTNGDQVRHTNVITAYNSRSLSGAGQWPTLPTEWIQAEKDIKELNAHPPVPGSDGYWLLWDLSSHSYQESDLPVPVGPAGPPNVLEIGTVETLPADQQATASITGESPAQKLNLGIPQGKQGATGNPGAPGKDGQNGVTPTLAAGNVETLEPDQPATASVTGEGPAYQINLGIPRGQTGAQGAPGQDGQDGQDGQTPTIAAGTVTTLDPGQDATAEITGETPNLTLNLGIPEGQPGQDGVQLNDNAVNTTEAWSSKKIVDTLCPSFSVSGNPVTCNPVEGYPLSAVVTLEPKQAGSGDPSPKNVRPITGWDEVTANVRGKNVFDSSVVLLGNKDEINLSFNAETQTFTMNGTTTLPSAAYFATYLENLIPTSESMTITVVKVGGSITIPDGKFALACFGKGDEYGQSVNSLLNATLDGGTRTVTNINDKKYLTRFWFYLTDGIVCDELKFKIQVEYGNTPTPYEPYQPGTTATLTLPETIYGGTVDVVTGVGSSDWTSVTFDGTENWQFYGFSEANNRIMTDVSIPVIEGYTEATMSNALMLNRTGQNMDGWITYYLQKPNVTTTRVVIWADGHSLDELKQIMATAASQGTPLQIVYKVANPTSFQATGNQALPAVAGLNTVYTDGDSLDVTGRQDLLYTMQSMQAQTQNLNRFIAEGGTQ